MSIHMIPEQKLTKKEKIRKFGSVENWAKACIDGIEGSHLHAELFNFGYYSKIQSNYNMYEGSVSPEDYGDVIAPAYNEENVGRYNDFPEGFAHYDIISARINRLLGEEMRRPFNYAAYAVNQDAISEAEKKYMDFIVAGLDGLLDREIKKRGLVPEEVRKKEGQTEDMTQMPAQPVEKDPYQELIEQVKSYSHKDIREVTANRLLNYLEKNLQLPYNFNLCLKDLLITGCEFIKIDHSGTNPYIRVVDPRFFSYDNSDRNMFVEDSAWAKEWRWVTLPAILNEFYDDLKEEDVEKLEKEQNENTYTYSSPFVHTLFENKGQARFVKGAGGSKLIKVVQFEWKSFKRIGFLMYIDPTTGEEVEQILGEDFNDFGLVKMLNGKIVWKWVNEVWEGTKIGSDVYVRLRPKPVQCRSIDNPSLCKLSYTGIAMNVSLMDRMKPLSLLYDIIKYRFNLLLARAKGKGIVVDVHQIPKQLGMDINKVMNFMETTGVLFINSMEEGRGGKVSSFNQFTEFDLSVGQNAAVYMQYMAYIEQTLTNITGIPPAYMGDPTNTNSGVQMEKSIVQSTIVNEHIFYLHNEFKRRALTLLIETAKYVYAGGKKIQYIAEDMSRSFINIEQDDPFCDSEYGVFITNGAKEMSIFEFIKNHATQMGMSAKEILSVLASNSIGESIKTIELAEKIKQQMEKEKQMHEQKLAQINAEAQEKQLKALSDFEIQKQKEKLEFEAKIAREKNDLEETLKKMEMETRLRIAEIQHMNRSY